MIDGGVVAAYLVMALARGGDRLLGRAVDSGLDRLAGSVARRLGRAPGEDLVRRPDDPVVARRAGRAIEDAADDDPLFARDLEDIVARLDRAGGRQLVNEVQAEFNVQAFNGDAHVGDYYEGNSYSADYDQGDELFSGRGPGRLVAVVGIIVALAGFVGWAYVIFSGMTARSAGFNAFAIEIARGIPLAPVAFGAFGVGGLLYALGTGASKAARKRAEEAEPRRRRRR